jgi:hypothetical protein
MGTKSQNSMRRLEPLDKSCTGRRAWFVSRLVIQ